MGGLDDPRDWECEAFSNDIIDALDQDLEEEGFHLAHSDWFTEGRSGEPVANTLRSQEGRLGGERLVLKFFRSNGEKRINRLQSAWRSSADFREHLAEVEVPSLILGDWRAAFMKVAGGDLERVGELSKLIGSPEFPDHCETIVRSIVDEWNPRNSYRLVPRTVGALLKEVLAHRKDNAITWAREAGIPVDGSSTSVALGDWPPVRVNPFSLLLGAAANITLDPVHLGKAHGDLSGRNILLPWQKPVEPGKFQLIDYDRFRKDAPLARDPMHLLVALVLDDLARPGSSLRESPDLAHVLVDPEQGGQQSPLHSHALLAAKIRDASNVRSRGLGEDWRRECLLFLAAAAMLHLGRDLRTEDKRRTKEWCFHLAALAAERFVATLPERIVTGSTRKLVGRSGESLRIRSLLTDGRPGVAVVSGKPGVGKTSLFDEIVGGLRSGASSETGIRIRRHEAKADTSLDTRTLIDYIEGRSNRAEPLGSLRVRLQTVLRNLGDKRVVLIVDAAENLLEPGTRTLADTDLDQALELLVNEPDHRVKVVLVSQEEPASSSDTHAWPGSTRMNLPQLDATDYPVFLATLGRDVRWDVDRLSAKARQDLYTTMQGNPRLGELARAVVLLGEAGPDLSQLAGLLGDDQPKDVLAYLIGRLVGAFDPHQCKVIAALVVLGTSVPASMVVEHHKGASPEFAEAVQRALDELVAARVVQEEKPGWYLVRSYEGALMGRLLLEEATRSERFARAAEQLTGLEERFPGDMSELNASFAELRALLNAELYAEAGRKIDGIDQVLREWNGRHRLLGQRQRVIGKLGDDLYELRNFNVLGQIYVAVDNFKEADKAYGRALELAKERDNDAWLAIQGNIATMHWLQHDIDRALGEYERLRDLAKPLGNDLVLMSALEGIADCHRRNGDYENALANARESIQVSLRPRLAKDAIAASGRVNMTLKLARWCGELGQLSEAEALLVDAQEGSFECGDRLHASWLDGHAVALFDRGDTEGARVAALEAAELASLQGDEVILLQSRTTLTFLHLVSGEFEEAWREARTALQHRKPYRSLIVLALAALAAHRAGAGSRARTLFDELYDDAETRIGYNSRDFTAHDMLAYAVCGKYQSTEVDLGEAVEALRTSRDIVVPPPKLVSRLRLMLEELDPGGDGLRPVLDAL